MPDRKTHEEELALAVIGGTGLYRMPGLADVSERLLDTPYGLPSAAVVLGRLDPDHFLGGGIQIDAELAR